MANDALTPPQRAALLLLLGVASEVGNNDLGERYGVTLTGKDKAHLNHAKLITSKKVKGFGNQFFHELTEPGWARAREELTGELPTGLWGRAVALSLAEQLDRYLHRADLRLHDVFRATEVTVAEPVVLSDRIRAAYWRITPKPNGWVLLSALREQLADVSRDDLDAALIALNAAPDVTYSTETNRKSLADRGESAVVIGAQKKHLIAIEGA
ncbi:hypothetical protein [Cryptosporangium japonicum]|uniref:Uncharacterized protein n=1 Tax=Cryptosporangium japonicum TaxID=80872 RepID=A0ABP3F018_9ACTN